ncbi:MAG: prepilin-type N-terminal cleavage/methylation domain-containing protein [Candidatus Edwardsbacteria bacterium]|nr:prepilin-type N-terminal cleavage/methylation domain-containing protein [Candidatus Edwardsbacteria bacterium]
MKNSKGFSLLEFLMSLFIVFVLATIGYTQYVTSSKNANQAAIIANMHTIQLCTEDFSTRADGAYPGDINTMVCKVSSNYLDSSVIAGTNKPPYPLKALIPGSTYNPIDSTHDAVRNGKARKPAGCVYYCGLDASGKPTGEGKPAFGYKITAMGYYRPLTDILTYRIPSEWGKGDK